MFTFDRRPGETIDALLSHFTRLTQRAHQEGGACMSIEGYPWQLLKACGVNEQELMMLLQPFQHRMPQTQAEFEYLVVALRRMGRIRERAPGNIASSLARGQSSSSRAHSTFLQTEGGASPQGASAGQQPVDPWIAGADPWSAAGADSWAAGGGSLQAEAPAAAEGVSGTVTDTASSFRDAVPAYLAEIATMNDAEAHEYLFWS